MKPLAVMFLLFQVSNFLLLECNKRKISARVGDEFLLRCSYSTGSLRYSKKYWCRGESRVTCEVLAHSEGGARGRSKVLDHGRHGLMVKVTGLQLDDTGEYWVGIDKPYADLMVPIKVVVTEVPVCKPGLWLLSSQVNRLTCWGEPVTVRCGCAEGSGVGYTWHQSVPNGDILLHRSSDLRLHCGIMGADSSFYCNASKQMISKEMSSEASGVLSVRVLVPAERDCIYVIYMEGQPVYDCRDRTTTTVATTPPLATCRTTKARNRSLQIIPTGSPDLSSSRTWTGLPLWYTVLRWCSPAVLLLSLCLGVRCTKA